MALDKTTKLGMNTPLPPQSLEAEKSVLGALLLDKESVNKVVDFLRPEDFYSRAHQIIYDHVLKLFAKNEPIDILSLSSKLQESNQIDNIGGVGYLTTLVNSVGTAAHIENHGRIIEKKKVLRDLIDTAHHIIDIGYKEEGDIGSLLDSAEQRLFSVSQRSVTQNFAPLGVHLHDAFERLDRLHKNDGVMRGAPTGFYDLDDMLAGLQKSDLIILAARPSLGKTTLALDIARNVAISAKLPVGVFSIEMSKEQVVDRLIASEANVSLWKMRTGKLSSEGENNDFQKIAGALDSLANVKIFVDDTASPTVLQMRAMARRLKAEHGLGLLVIDYLQLIKPNREYDSAVQQITEISRNLKALARELDIPVLALSQLSRASEMRTDQRPKLSDLRDSGSIEQDADVVMMIYREDKVKRESDKKNIAEIIIAKHRNGPTGHIELFFDEDQVSFKNLSKSF